MIPNTFACIHYWVSTKDSHQIQCIHCGLKKEVDEVQMTPSEEDMEVS